MTNVKSNIQSLAIHELQKLIGLENSRNLDLIYGETQTTDVKLTITWRMRWIRHKVEYGYLNSSNNGKYPSIIDAQSQANNAGNLALKEGSLHDQLLQYVSNINIDNFNIHNIQLNKTRTFTGSDLCRKCNGHKELTCGTCSGKGLLTCRTCNGSTRVVCRNCGGSGQTDSRGGEYRYERCGVCGGSGNTHCPSCLNPVNYAAGAGPGKLSCNTCGSSGRLTCRSCSGHGAFYESYEVEVYAEPKLSVEYTGKKSIGISNYLSSAKYLCNILKLGSIKSKKVLSEGYSTKLVIDASFEEHSVNVKGYDQSISIVGENELKCTSFNQFVENYLIREHGKMRRSFNASSLDTLRSIPVLYNKIDPVKNLDTTLVSTSVSDTVINGYIDEFSRWINQLEKSAKSSALGLNFILSSILAGLVFWTLSLLATGNDLIDMVHIVPQDGIFLRPFYGLRPEYLILSIMVFYSLTLFSVQRLLITPIKSFWLKHMLSILIFSLLLACLVFLPMWFESTVLPNHLIFQYDLGNLVGVMSYQGESILLFSWLFSLAIMFFVGLGLRKYKVRKAFKFINDPNILKWIEAGSHKTAETKYMGY